MKSADIDVLIIGAGVVGLAIACELGNRFPNQRIMVAEKNRKPGQEISSRNSGVIHAGIYYPTSSLKASLCVEGSRLLYNFCAVHHIPHRRIGKLIVAVDESDLVPLQALYQQGTANGAELEYLETRDMVNKLEPGINAIAAIYSPNTGIIDVPALVQALYYNARKQRIMFGMDCPIDSLQFLDDFYEIRSGHDSIKARVVINSAGLQSDRIAALAGIDIDNSGYRLHYCKGEYYRMKGIRPTHLVYPLPGAAGLGIHTTPDLSGAYRLGPNSYYVNDIDYNVDERSAEAFLESASRYLPGLQRENISIDFAGIRPKLQAPGENFRDFVITDEKEQGLPGLINLIGIESPGLTSSLAIGQYVTSLFADKYANR
ncbi:MAG TPA: NAD(P)/FAD-dependent oxidoreductase [Syntrophomonadaceae bacterium]|nr:NAD(P)/FAD-dependent oxidoreductase [Syntrophomonadaceae bacterium]